MTHEETQRGSEGPSWEAGSWEPSWESGSWTAGGAGDTAATGGTGNAAYRYLTLRFQQVQLGFSESVSLGALFLFWLRALIVSFLVFLLFFFIWVIAASRGSMIDGYSLGILGFGLFMSLVAFWGVLLLSQVQEPISEWRTLLEDKAEAAPSSYAAIYGALGRRSIPVRVSAQRIRSDLLEPEAVNNRLVIADRPYVAYVSVFRYGTSLYVGWTMWRNRSGGELVGTFFKDVFGSFVGRTSTVHQMLRTEKPRAMREAVHSAVREGVEVASSGAEVSIKATFGEELPIETLSLQTPAPAPPAPPSQNPAS